MDAFIAQMILTFALLVIFGGLFFWGLKTRQFHNPEEPKYHVLDQKEHRDRGEKNDS